MQENGAGIVLIPLEGEPLEYCLRFAFPTSNNVPEYEALIIGLRLAQKLEGTQLIAHSDSQLIVQQYRGQYETKDPVMGQYLQKVKTHSCLKFFNLLKSTDPLIVMLTLCPNWHPLKKPSEEQCSWKSFNDQV